MSFKEKIAALAEIQHKLNPIPDSLQETIHKAFADNQWFTKENMMLSIESVRDYFFDKEKLEKWLSGYSESKVSKTIGIIAAGNLPLVAFHDVLCCFVLDAPVKIKLSSKDYQLMNYFINLLKEADSNWKIDIVEKLTGYDAVIATGSNNTHRYFEEYFSHVPNILRKNRNSVAILNGQETDEEIEKLADDIFMYFGMGCRNVSKLFLPENYDVTQLFPKFSKFEHYADHKLYKDNFDYNCTLLLMNQVPHLANYFVILKEDNSLHPRLATLHYSFYKNEAEVNKYLDANKDEIQCIVGKFNNFIPFGKTQQPELWDYADNIDTVEFLSGL